MSIDNLRKDMKKIKTRKSISKRFKIAKASKEVLYRAPGQDHFNAREKGETVNKKRRDKSFSARYSRVIKTAIVN